MTNTAREIVEIKATIPKEEIKLRVAAYARVSSNSEEQLNSFSNQMTYYTKLVEEKEVWELIDVYADEGISGVSAKKRTEFNRLLEDCRDGKIDRVITKSVSRFARNTLDSIQAIRELKALGVTIYFEKEGIDTAKLSSENLITLYSNFAQEESMNISKNCKKGIRMKMEKGIYLASNPPFGYRIVDKELVIHQDEAEVVKRVFFEYLSGKGIGEIVNLFNSEGIPWNKGKKVWNKKIISEMIRNERYKGDTVHQKRFNEDVLPYTSRRNKGEIPQYLVKNTHEGIVLPFQFDVANLILSENGSKICTEYKNLTLSKKIHCSCCGTLFTHKTTNNKRYWVCGKHFERKDNCPSQRIPEANIQLSFVTLYNKLRNNYKTILVPLQEGLEQLLMNATHSNDDIIEINKKIADLSEQNFNLSALMAQGILDNVLFIPQIDAIKKEMEELKRRKKRFVSKIDKDNSADQIAKLIATLKQGPTTISKFDPELFEEIVENIIAYDKEKIKFVLYGELILEERL